MTSAEHRTWFRENIAWFEALPLDVLDRDIPACPGWTIDDVLNHLTFGLGVGYPLGLAAAPDADPATVFADLVVPAESPRGPAALDAFRRHMGACADRFDQVEPGTPCWTYAGPGVAAFWFRRAAIETWLHRVDVVDAVPELDEALADDRARDAIEETFEFTFPLASALVGQPTSQLLVDSSCLPSPLTFGSDDHTQDQPRVALRGDGHDVLLALWGRHLDRIEVDGPDQAAQEWLGLVEAAFARPS